MAEQEKEEFAFIKEKIKEKPVNKKRLFKHGMYTVGFAVIFGSILLRIYVPAPGHGELAASEGRLNDHDPGG